MTAELKTALDSYLTAWITRFEPPTAPRSAENVRATVTVSWSPERFVHTNAALGPELDDIDIVRIHDMLDSGTHALWTLADAVERTPRHVRWAISAHPLPSGALITPIDWLPELLRLP